MMKIIFSCSQISITNYIRLHYVFLIHSFHSACATKSFICLGGNCPLCSCLVKDAEIWRHFTGGHRIKVILRGSMGSVQAKVNYLCPQPHILYKYSGWDWRNTVVPHVQSKPPRSFWQETKYKSSLYNFLIISMVWMLFQSLFRTKTNTFQVENV